jgi:hypothetical protein
MSDPPVTSDAALTAFSREAMAEASPESVRIFVDHAWDVLRWHREQAEKWDRIAVQVLAFAGLMATIVGRVVFAVPEVLDPWYRWLVAGGLILALALLVLTCILSLVSLMGRLRRIRTYPEEVQTHWARFRADPTSNSAELLGVLADSLIGVPGDRKAAIVDLALAARRRETRTRTASVLLGIAVLLIAGVLLAFLLGPGLPPTLVL